MAYHNMQADGNEAKQSTNEQSKRSSKGLKRRSVLKLAGASTGAAAGGLGAINYGSRPVSAASPGEAHVIDDFEDGSLSEYSFDRGSSGASIVSSPTYDGSYALELCGANTEMISMNDLGHYPSAGDVFSYWVRATDGAEDTNFTYGVQNHENRYYLNLDFVNNQVHYNVLEGGSQDWRSYTDVTLTEDTWYRVEINWGEDGSHEATLLDTSDSQLAKVSMSDSTWKAGGIGYDAYVSDGSSVFYDRVTLESGREVKDFANVIDSFEDENLEEYFFAAGKEGAELVSQPIVEGTNALRLKGTTTEMFSSSNLENYPEAGDIFSVWVRAKNNTGDVNFNYGVQDENNYYYLNLDFENNQMHYNTLKDGSQEWQTYADVTLNEGSWYELEIDWRDTGNHIATIYSSDRRELQQISMEDSAWLNGGIGFSAYLSADETVYWDRAAIHTSVKDDFEDGDLKEYDGETGSFSVQNSTTIEGDYSLKGSSCPSTISNTNIKTKRGYRYTSSVKIGSGSSSMPGIVCSIQDPQNPLYNCYYSVIDCQNNQISLYRTDDGVETCLQKTDVSLSEGTVYHLSIELRPTTVHAEVTDQDGSPLAEAGEHDDTHYGGFFGLHISNDTPAFFDYIREKQITREILDTFEDGDISEYDGDTSCYSVQNSVSLRGQQSLKCEILDSSITNTLFTTSRGYEYITYTKIGQNSNSSPALLANIQDSANPNRDSYMARIDPRNNTLILARNESGSTHILDEVSVSIEDEEIYRIGLSLFDGSLQATLYSNRGIVLERTSRINDSTYQKGSIGIYTCGDSAPAFYDHLQEIPLSDVSRNEVSESQTRGEEVLNNKYTQEILSELDDPTTNPSESKRQNTYIDERDLVGHVVSFPIEYGEIKATYENEDDLFSVKAVLQRSEMPSYLINDLSDDFGWPSSIEEASLINSDFREVSFMRNVTKSEGDDIKSLISNSKGRDDTPGNITVINNNGGVYRAYYYDRIYDTNQAVDTIEYEEEHLKTESTCMGSNLGCAISAAGVSLSSKGAALACLSVPGTGGASAPACAIAASSFVVSSIGYGVSCYFAARCD